MPISIVTYTGDLHTSAIHSRSGTRIETDAPPDNRGKGENFSPTDLAATSLACCLLTIMGIKARDMNLDIRESYAEVEKIMVSNPRRISTIRIHVHMRNVTNEKEKKILEQAALNCPVAKSLHPDIKQEIRFIWKG